MAQQGLSQPPLSSSTSENPVVAIGRKVKSVLTSHQRPSIRILRESSSIGEPRRAPASNGIVEKSLPFLPHEKAQGPKSRTELNEHSAAHEKNTFAGIRNRTGDAIRSLFGREEDPTNDQSFEHEYDTDTVDLLDVVGKYDHARFNEQTDSLQIQKCLHFLPSRMSKIHFLFPLWEEFSTVGLPTEFRSALKRLAWLTRSKFC